MQQRLAINLCYHTPSKYNYLSYTVFKGLLKTPKHNTKKDKPVSIYMYSLLQLCPAA